MQKEQVAMRFDGPKLYHFPDGVNRDGSPRMRRVDVPIEWQQPFWTSTQAQLKADTYELIASLRPTTLVLLMAWLITSPPVLCVYRGRNTQRVEFLALTV